MVISADVPSEKTNREICAEVSEPFAGKSFEDVYEKARLLESLVAALGSTDIFEFQAVYDVDKDTWTGYLYNRSLNNAPALYDNSY